MRKFLLILFIAMLPLQWTAAAAAALCLPGAGSGASMDGQAVTATHHAWGPAHQAAAHHPATALSEPDDPGHRAHGHDDGSVHVDCGGCCHATCSVLPAAALGVGAQATPAAAPQPVIQPLASPSLDGLFRPPRMPLA